MKDLLLSLSSRRTHARLPLPQRSARLGTETPIGQPPTSADGHTSLQELRLRLDVLEPAPCEHYEFQAQVWRQDSRTITLQFRSLPTCHSSIHYLCPRQSASSLVATRNQAGKTPFLVPASRRIRHDCR